MSERIECLCAAELQIHAFFFLLLIWQLYSACRYATPFGLTSEYAHPAEILFLGFATVVGPAITGPHLMTLWLWMVLRVLETVEAHCGYHFPWSPSNFIPLYGGWAVRMLDIQSPQRLQLSAMLHLHSFFWLQFWFSRLSSSVAVHQVWELLFNLCLHGLVSSSFHLVLLWDIMYSFFSIRRGFQFQLRLCGLREWRVWIWCAVMQVIASLLGDDWDL